MESNSPASQQSGLTRAALLMMSLGEDAAAEVFKYLTAREVQLLGSAMASLKQVTRDDVSAALEEFRQEADQFMAVSLGSDEYIRSVLTKALGSDRAASLIEDILEASEGSSGIDALNWLDANTVAELIGDEHPQIIATILVHLERDRAAAVLALLGERPSSPSRSPTSAGSKASLPVRSRPCTPCSRRACTWRSRARRYSCATAGRPQRRCCSPCIRDAR